MHLLIAVLMALRVSLPPLVVEAQTACPTDVPVIRSGVVLIISQPNIRSSVGLTAVNPDSLRLLTDTADASVCRTLKERYVVTPLHAGGTPRWIYYKAGTFYFAAVFSVDTAGRLLPRKGDLWIFDSTLTPKARYVL